MASGMTSEFMSQIILREIERRVAEALAAEVEKAKAYVEAAVKRQVGSIALSVLSEYDIEARTDHLVIKVRRA
mgnify:CR=1 FL=1